MNKQEFSKKIVSWGSWCTDVHDGKKDRYVKISKVQEFIEELDEPQKVKVPAAIGNHIRKRKIDGDNFHESILATNSQIYEWYMENAELYEQAWVNGYEVEEEPKWKIINDQKYCLTSIEAGYGNSLHWAFDSTKKKPILFDNEETALYTAYITGGKAKKV